MAEIVAEDPSVVILACLRSRLLSAVLDPDLHRTLRPIDDRLPALDDFLLNMPGNGIFEFDSEPRLTLLTVDVLARGYVLISNTFVPII